MKLAEFATKQNTGAVVYVKLKDGKILGPYDSKAAAYTAAKNKDLLWIKDEKQLTPADKADMFPK